MVVTALVIAACLPRAGKQSVWVFAKGTGAVASWKINGDSTRLEVQPRKGKLRRYFLRENKFEATLYDPQSALDIGKSRLVVTHHGGVFVVDALGRILNRFWVNDLVDHPEEVKYFQVSSKVSPGKELAPTYLVAKSSNESTIAFSGAPFRSALMLMSRQLKPICVVDFPGSLYHLSRIPGGWKCEVGHSAQRTAFSVTNTGSIRIKSFHRDGKSHKRTAR